MTYDDNDLTGNLVFDWGGNIKDPNTNPPSPTQYQFLIASQNYGTMYGVYAKFHLKLEGEKKFITKIELSLINYKGVINIGLCSNSNGKVDMYMENLKESPNILLLKMPVQGSNNNFFAEGDLAPYAKDRIDITGINKIVINRELHMLTGDSGSFQRTIFDNEFYYRDGVHQIKNPERTLRPGMKNYQGEAEKDFLISTNCHTSNLTLHHKQN